MNLEYEEYFFEAPFEKKNKKYLTLIIYDISDNKRRLKMVKLLENFGYRVQKSAFEALLDRQSLNKLKSQIPLCIQREGLVKIYYLRGNSETFSWGDMKDIEDDEVLFI